ncbi:unnamed protein product [Trichogramma brassicae]|uniref:Uncharacterized protein n=1 Tax=Trichogramma brassicae TaxID=86971 RepID=A0A6H5IM37_9HYME|nr:unnamed protein product [Trichogramma brassicae]
MLLSYRCEARSKLSACKQLIKKTEGTAHHQQEESGNHHHHGRRPQHTLVPLHPLPGPAHRRQAEVRPPPPNSQREGSRSDRCTREDHAQLRRARRSSRRKLYAHVVDSILLYGAPIWSTAAQKRAYIRQAESAHRRACLRVIGGRPHVSYEATYVLAGIPPLALLADERARLYSRRREDAKDEETLGNAKQVAGGSMGPVDEGPMDASTDPKYQNVDREEARRAELPPHAALDRARLLFKNTIANATITIKARNARFAPHPSRTRSMYFTTARGSAERGRDYMPYCTRYQMRSK